MGIAELLHMLAILTQQACSAAVIVCPGVMQAAKGCAISNSVTAIAAICEALFMSTKGGARPYILQSNTPRWFGFPL